MARRGVPRRWLEWTAEPLDPPMEPTLEEVPELEDSADEELVSDKDLINEEDLANDKELLNGYLVAVVKTTVKTSLKQPREDKERTTDFDET